MFFDAASSARHGRTRPKGRGSASQTGFREDITNLFPPRQPGGRTTRADLALFQEILDDGSPWISPVGTPALRSPARLALFLPQDTRGGVLFRGPALETELGVLFNGSRERLRRPHSAVLLAGPRLS